MFCRQFASLLATSWICPSFGSKAIAQLQEARVIDITTPATLIIRSVGGEGSPKQESATPRAAPTLSPSSAPTDVMRLPQVPLRVPKTSTADLKLFDSKLIGSNCNNVTDCAYRLPVTTIRQGDESVASTAGVDCVCPSIQADMKGSCKSHRTCCVTDNETGPACRSDGDCCGSKACFKAKGTCM